MICPANQASITSELAQLSDGSRIIIPLIPVSVGISSMIFAEQIPILRGFVSLNPIDRGFPIVMFQYQVG